MCFFKAAAAAAPRWEPCLSLTDEMIDENLTADDGKEIVNTKYPLQEYVFVIWCLI